MNYLHVSMFTSYYTDQAIKRPETFSIILFSEKPYMYNKNKESTRWNL